MRMENLERANDLRKEIRLTEKCIEVAQALREDGRFNLEFFQDGFGREPFFHIPPDVMKALRECWIAQGRARIAVLQDEFKTL